MDDRIMLSAIGAHDIFTGKSKEKRCDAVTCSKTQNLRACSGCKSKYYCSRKCQKAHWFYHKFDCKNKQWNDSKKKNPNATPQCPDCGGVVVDRSKTDSGMHFYCEKKHRFHVSQISGKVHSNIG